MSRECAVDELLSPLAPGDAVFLSGSAGEPKGLTQLLSECPEVGVGLHFITSFVPGINSARLAAAGARRQDVFFMQAGYAQDRARRDLRYLPLNYYGVHQHLTRAETRVDAVVVQVSEPDADGRCCFGPTAEFLPGLIERAPRLFAVVNPRVPRLRGAPSLPIDRFERYAYSDSPLSSYDAGPSNEVARQVAEYLMTLIPDGATLQMGLGKLPNQFAAMLARKRNLVLHSGMLSDSMLDLIDAGCLSRDHPLTATVAVGSPALYAALPRVQADLRFLGVGYTHAPSVLAALPKLHAVNSALEVDLLGQVNADTLKGRSVGGPGGLPDFASAAHRCADGLSIIALPAVDPASGVSRIVSRLAPRTPVSVPHTDVDAVVTEFGIAMLRGEDVETRALRLIAVADPRHRASLLDQFKADT